MSLTSAWTSRTPDVANPAMALSLFHYPGDILPRDRGDEVVVVIIVQYTDTGCLCCSRDQQIRNLHASVVTALYELFLHLSSTQQHRFGDGNVRQRGEHGGQAPIVIGVSRSTSSRSMSL